MAQAPASKKTAKVSSKTAVKTPASTAKPVNAKTSTPAKPTASSAKPRKGVANKPFAQGTGRRKSSVASALLRKGNGQILINGRPFDQYFTVLTAQKDCQQSFTAFPMTSGMLADVKVVGGGVCSQANAVRLGIARALLQFDASLKSELRKQGFLTVDSRVKERKKYGQKAARRKFQFTKR
jgi:small subunit ribosomal protein S9